METDYLKIKSLKVVFLDYCLEYGIMADMGDYEVLLDFRYYGYDQAEAKANEMADILNIKEKALRNYKKIKGSL